MFECRSICGGILKDKYNCTTFTDAIYIFTSTCVISKTKPVCIHTLQHWWTWWEEKNQYFILAHMLRLTVYQVSLNLSQLKILTNDINNLRKCWISQCMFALDAIELYQTWPKHSCPLHLRIHLRLKQNHEELIAIVYFIFDSVLLKS